MVDWRSMPVLFVVLTILLFTSQGFCQSVTPIKDKIDGELAGTAVFRWKVNRVQMDMQLLSLILYRGATLNRSASLFTGFAKSPLPVPGKNVDRLNATVFGTANQDLELTYQVTLEDLTFNDTNSAFFLRGLFESTISGLKKEPGASITLTTVKGGPIFCGRDLLASYTFSENAQESIYITLCGVPAPTVRWKFFESGYLNASRVKINDYNFTYSIKLPQLTQEMCGRELSIKAEGHKVEEPRKSQVFLTNFTPAAVPNVTAQRLYSGNCTKVHWHTVDTGLCLVEYTVQFLNDTGVLGNITGIEHNNLSICSKEYFNATTIVIWATYNGTEGNKTRKMVSLTTTTATTTTTTSTTAEPGVTPNVPRVGESDSNSTTTIIIVVLVVLLVIIVIIVVVFVMTRKRKHINGKTSKRQDDVMELKQQSYTDEGDYASVDPMQKKSTPEENPDQMLYAELGAGGGRKGPKPEPVESNYAQVKVDDMGYPARGPASDMSQPPHYPTSINRDRSRRHSPPPNYGEMDDDDGVIV